MREHVLRTAGAVVLLAFASALAACGAETRPAPKTADGGSARPAAGFQSPADLGAPAKDASRAEGPIAGESPNAPPLETVTTLIRYQNLYPLLVRPVYGEKSIDDTTLRYWIGADRPPILEWNSLSGGYVRAFNSGALVPGPSRFSILASNRKDNSVFRSGSYVAYPAGPFEFLGGTARQGGTPVKRVVQLAASSDSLFVQFENANQGKVLKRYRIGQDGAPVYDADVNVWADGLKGSGESVWARVESGEDGDRWIDINRRGGSLPGLKRDPVPDLGERYRDWNLLVNAALSLDSEDHLFVEMGGRCFAAVGDSVIVLEPNSAQRTLRESGRAKIGAGLRRLAGAGTRLVVAMDDGSIAVLSWSKGPGIEVLGRAGPAASGDGRRIQPKEIQLAVVGSRAYVSAGGFRLLAYSIGGSGLPAFSGEFRLEAPMDGRAAMVGDGIEFEFRENGDQVLRELWLPDAKGGFAPWKGAIPDGLDVLHVLRGAAYLGPDQSLRPVSPEKLYRADLASGEISECALLGAAVIASGGYAGVRRWLRLSGGEGLLEAERRDGGSDLVSVDLERGTVTGRAKLANPDRDLWPKLYYSSGIAMAEDGSAWSLRADGAFEPREMEAGYYTPIGETPDGIMAVLRTESPSKGSSGGNPRLVEITQEGMRAFDGFPYSDEWASSIKKVQKFGRYIVGENAVYGTPRLFAFDAETGKVYLSPVPLHAAGVVAGRICLLPAIGPWTFLSYE